MQIHTLSHHEVPYVIAGNILQLAHQHAPEFVQDAISPDSPLLGLAQAEVYELLGDALRSIGNPEPVQINSVLYQARAGAIIAIDETVGDGTFAGFIQFKPGLPLGDSASIGYAAVSEKYRGQGVFRQMLDALRKLYPALALDCPMALVPMYERLGFKIEGQQGIHVEMRTAPVTGQLWGRDQEYLDHTKAVINAKKAIREALGKDTKCAYEKRDKETRLLKEEVKAFVEARLSAAAASE